MAAVLATMMPSAAKAQQQDLLSQMRQAEGYSVFTRLVEAVGLEAELQQPVNDESYDYLKYNAGVSYWLANGTYRPMIPQTRPIHTYTIFAETDDCYATIIGKPAASITPDDVKAWLATNGYYAGEADALRQFVTYHILPVRLTPNQLVIHNNELGYNYKTGGMPTVFTSEHYETLGTGRRLLQLSEGGGVKGIYLNRCPVLGNGREGRTNNYMELGNPIVKGIIVDQSKTVEAVNGYAYSINEPLIYTVEVREKVLGGRIRYDIMSLLPELAVYRAPRSEFPEGDGITLYIPEGFCDALTLNDEDLWLNGRYALYLTGFNRNWWNYQSDEFNVSSGYDFTLRLPPVPADGEYELRLAVQGGTSYNAVTLFSIGTDKQSLTPTSLPVDLRLSGAYWRTTSGNALSGLGWEADNGDEIHDRFIDLRLYEQGFMKGPQHYSFTPGNDNNTARSNNSTLRRIIHRGEFKAGETYYLRVQYTGGNSNGYMYLDYLELCPKSVYANPDVPEDIW